MFLAWDVSCGLDSTAHPWVRTPQASRGLLQVLAADTVKLGKAYCFALPKATFPGLLSPQG